MTTTVVSAKESVSGYAVSSRPGPKYLYSIAIYSAVFAGFFTIVAFPFVGALVSGL